MADFLDEVKEDLRRERYRELVDRYKVVLIAALAGIIGVTAGISLYDHYQREAKLEAAALYREVAMELREEDWVSALPRLNMVIEQGTHGYQLLARFHKAHIMVEQGEIDEALLMYDSIIADSAADLALRDLAILLSTWVMMEHGDADDHENIDLRLKAIAGQGKPWHYSALELQAVQAMRLNQPDVARGIMLSYIGEPLVPRALKERSEKLLRHLQQPQELGSADKE